MTGTWKDFEGINNLSGTEKIIGTVLLKNELGGVSNGYELSHADGSTVGGNSGYSFGGNQLDLASNTIHARSILRDILQNAKDSDGNFIVEDGGDFYDNHQTQIEAQGNPFALSSAEQSVINSALSSEYGKTKLNNDFSTEVQGRINDVNTVINSLPEGNIKSTIQHSDELLTYLVDYQNQYGFSVGFGMFNFLSGQQVNSTGGTSGPLDDMVLAEDISQFISQQLQAVNNPNDFARRQDNIKDTLDEFQVGKYLSGNDEDQTFLGTEYNDTIIGNGGNDIINGNGGKDTVVFSGNLDDYTLTQNPDGSWQIEHNVTGDVDTVSEVEKGQFADQTITLSAPKQDIVLAIDVSGSMGDDIAAVKSQAESIIDNVMGFANASESRLGIVTFNDTGSINTALNLTDSRDSALSGINGVSILGGGAEPLNGALLHAIRGGAGAWRTDADVARKIIVFSDEPPADPDLADEVAQESAKLRVKIDTQQSGDEPIDEAAEFSTFSSPLISQSFAVQAIETESGTEYMPVNIYTVAIGNSQATIDALAQIAADNRGEAFTAANANQLVDALVEAINDPVVEEPELNHPDLTRYQAEDAALTGGAFVDDRQANFDGDGYVDYRNASDDAITFTVEAGDGGLFTIDVGYALGSGGARPLDVYVNDALVIDGLDFALTANWQTWGEETFQTLLNAGTNEIRLEADGASGANVDYIDVEYAGTQTAPEVDLGEGRYEAEDAVLHGVKVDDYLAGASQGDYVDYQHASDDFIEWNIYSTEGGNYQLDFGYVLGSGGARPLDVYINDELVYDNLDFALTNGWTDWQELGVETELQSGNNSIKLLADGASGGNFDYLDVTYIGS